MKIVIGSTDLAALLAYAGAIARHDQSVLIIAERIGEPIATADMNETAPTPGHVRIVAFNDNATLEWRRPAEITQPGYVAVQLGALDKFVKASIKSDATLSIETKDLSTRQSLRIDGARSSHEFETGPADAFNAIAIGRIEGEAADLKHFATALATAQIATASPTEAAGARIALTGVHVRPRGDTIDVVGTDGKRMALCRLRHVDIEAVDMTEIQDGATMPTATIALVSKVMASGPCKVAFTAESIIVQGQDGSISARLIDAPYPDYARLMGIKTATEIELDLDSLTTALSRTSASIGREDRFTAAEIVRDPAGTHLVSRTTAQSSSEIVDETGGAEARIGFDARYMASALKGLSTRRVRVSFTDASTPIFVEGVDRTDVRMLVMPCRV